jgi:hypothetical protein
LAGVPNKRTQELLAPVGDTSGVTSKEVMRQAMHLHWAARFTTEGTLDWQHIAAELLASAENAEQAAEALASRDDLPNGTGETRH